MKNAFFSIIAKNQKYLFSVIILAIVFSFTSCSITDINKADETTTSSKSTVSTTKIIESTTKIKKTEAETTKKSKNTTKATSSSYDYKKSVHNNYMDLFSSVPDSKAVTKSSGSIYKGLLILVNNDHKFMLDEPEDVMDMDDLSNRNFYIAYDYLDADRFTLKQFNIMNGRYVNKYGEKLQVCSGYRTVATQKRNFDNSVAKVGEEETLKWFTRPGYSEHHTGYAIDYNTDSFGDAAFTGKGNQAWVQNNCDKYGFIHRYDKSKKSITGVNHEAWHFRQVGLPHAKYITDNSLCLEEYIENIKEFTKSSPLSVSTEFSGKYDIWYVKSAGDKTSVNLDGYSKYLISGNNVDGFIVTAVK